MAQEKRLGEVSSQCRRWWRHRNEMQKDVRTEHDENESEKYPSNNRCDFHLHIVPWLIRNSNVEILEGARRLEHCSDFSPIENRFQYRFGFENFSGDGASGAGMFRVIRVNCFHGVGDFVQRAEG